MRISFALPFLLSAIAFSHSDAQDKSRLDVAMSYTYIHSNAPPGGCGCFNWNGGSVSAAWHLNPQWSIAGQFGMAHAGNEAGSSISPLLASYVAGPHMELFKHEHRVRPFAELLLGVAHVSNGYFPAGTTSSSSATNFALSTGGGIDVPIGRRVTLRAVEADYFLTLLPNGVNGRENNVRVSTGIVFRFPGR